MSTFPPVLEGSVAAAAAKGSPPEAVAAVAIETKSLLRTLGILSTIEELGDERLLGGGGSKLPHNPPPNLQPSSDLHLVLVPQAKYVSTRLAARLLIDIKRVHILSLSGATTSMELPGSAKYA